MITIGIVTNEKESLFQKKTLWISLHARKKTCMWSYETFNVYGKDSENRMLYAYVLVKKTRMCEYKKNVNPLQKWQKIN